MESSRTHKSTTEDGILIDLVTSVSDSIWVYNSLNDELENQNGLHWADGTVLVCQPNGGKSNTPLGAFYALFCIRRYTPEMLLERDPIRSGQFWDPPAIPEGLMERLKTQVSPLPTSSPYPMVAAFWILSNDSYFEELTHVWMYPSKALELAMSA